MNRSGPVTFLIFAVIAVMIVLQVLSMIQSDRLYERLNYLAESWKRTPVRYDSGGGDSDSPAGSGAEGLADYKGDFGDWLVYHISGEPKTLNPYTVEGTISTRQVVTNTIFERLFDYDLDYGGVKLKPWLATGMDISDDGLTYTVYLRDDIHFSDGVAITADDVVFTYETIMDPKVDAADIRNYYSNIEHVKKIDERTIKFRFREIYWKTLETVGIFEVLPKHIYEYEDATEFNTRRSNPVGSGPYVFERWDVGSQIVLGRNENYWGPKPRVEKRVYKIITNEKAALASIKAGNIDFMEPTSQQYADMLEDKDFAENYRLMSFWEPSVPYFFIGWNQQRPFFKDKMVRRAMTHLVDREAIAEDLLRGEAETVTGPFYKYGKQYDSEIQPWSFDIEEAKRLLEQAGWVDSDGDGIRDREGVKFSFSFSYSTGSFIAEQLAKLLKDNAAMAGVEVTADPYEWSIFINKMNDRQFDAGMLGWGGTIESDPYQIFHSSQIEGRGNNFVSFNSAEADALIEQARVTLDAEERYELYHRFHAILHEEQPYTFLITRPTHVFLDRRFENVIEHTLGLDAMEWYVPFEDQKYK